MIAGAVVLVFVGVGLRVGFEDWYDARTKNPIAIAAGFVDYREMDAAKAAGITDAAAWHKKVADDSKNKAAEDARKAAEIAAAEKTLAELRRNPAENMTVQKMSWEKGGFDTVGIVTLTIRNQNNFPVKDISFLCTFNGKSGTTLTEKLHTIYDTMKAKSQKTFHKMNIGFISSQAARAGCNLISAKRF